MRCQARHLKDLIVAKVAAKEEAARKHAELDKICKQIEVQVSGVIPTLKGANPGAACKYSFFGAPVAVTES